MAKIIMKTQQELKTAIMGRIYTAYAMRRIFRSSTVRAFLSVGSLAAIFSFVSVLNVIKNLMNIGSPSALYDFSVTAISQTEAGVQFALVLFVAALAWYVADIVRSLASPTGSRIS